MYLSHRKAEVMSWLMIIASLVFLLLPVKLHSQSDTTVFNRNEPDLIFQGDAQVEAGADFISLTTMSHNNRVGRALYSPPIRLWDRAGRRQANFQTVFKASMCALEERQLNGISFFITPVNATIPIASTTGGNMGLYDASSGTSPVPLVAVELDRYVNSWDPNYRHVGININSRNSVAVDRWEWNTTASTIPGYPSCFTTVETRITYDARQRLISVFANATKFWPPIQQFISRVEYMYDLKTALPEWVQIGFSSTTERGESSGTIRGLHDIRSWSFISFMMPDDVNRPDEDNYNRQYA